MTPPAEDLLHGPQALRRQCMQHAKRSLTRANIEKIKQEIAAVDADSQKMTATIDVRLILQRSHQSSLTMRMTLACARYARPLTPILQS